MSRYKFSSAERWAIFLVHGMKCYLCNIPIDLSTMVVDHVLPECLLDSPSACSAAKSKLGLPASFDLNSFENWLPACSVCNGTKSSVQFEPSPLIQVLLQKLAAKADEAHRISSKVVRDRQVANALNVLERAYESGVMLEEKARERLSVLWQFASVQELVDNGQPLRLTPSFYLVTTTVKDALDWGATHWSIPPREPGEPSLVVLFRAERGECVDCGMIQRVFQPINQEGGGDAICAVCLSSLDWMSPVALGDLPTHCRDK
ncbi:HNH endonuclease [Pseudomonas sp. YQ_5]|uniref:HNH endonuclease n=1 Tax=Pseudomonas sp. YQ_5 TaxID=3367229 RepID=UPI00370CE1C0